ncbi:ATP-NAD kinase-like domain-containing protein [Fimicolochytrium jonesii]|uniref:ATP-NAD kinase-like domain-containing protein n=1 Tax=Fimicolochytrium jonesii TaxID=1396493 RepID=UPI0022FE4371|nr:ATP-NAD kinase-like domain-containing protein [Fimicolochytrium jonesii]KAI8819341.1 ATP-NAD kinase-like domain-containing protein [Fimicolochytrium jonesii]
MAPAVTSPGVTPTAVSTADKRVHPESEIKENGMSPEQIATEKELQHLLNIPPISLGDNAETNSRTTHTRPEGDDSYPGPKRNTSVRVEGGNGKERPADDAAAIVSSEGVDGETLVVVPTEYVFIFSNPKSGNQQGLPLVQMNIQHYRMRDNPHVQVQLYDFLDEKDRSAGLKYLHLLLTKQKSIKKLHVWSAGGDGTLIGVVEGMIQMGLDVEHDERIFFSVIPFGTGNDLSQVLGWGRYVAGSDVAGKHLEGLNKIVQDRLNGHVTLLDIWDVELETAEGGWVREAGKEKTRTVRRKMSNYSSIGLQGRVGLGFEENRRGSRVKNAMEYSRQSLGVLVHGAPPITNCVKALVAAGDRFELDGNKKLRVTHEPIEMVIQNIPGMWGRHVDLWGVAEMSRSIVREQKGATDISNWTPHCAYDGKLEVFGIGSLRSYFRKQFSFGRKHLQRVGQMPSPFSIEFIPESTFHAMIDGEFYETYNATNITYKRILQIKLIGSDPEHSRLVSDLLKKKSELPGPTGEGREPGVDFVVGKTEYAEETPHDRLERRMSDELVGQRSREGTPKEGHSRAETQTKSAGEPKVPEDVDVPDAAR